MEPASESGSPRALLHLSADSVADPVAARAAAAEFERRARDPAQRDSLLHVDGVEEALVKSLRNSATAESASRTVDALSVDAEFRLRAADCGAVEALVSLVGENTAGATRTAATGALRSLAAGFSPSSTAIRSRIVAAGAVPPLLRVLASPGPGADVPGAADADGGAAARRRSSSDASTSGRATRAPSALRLEAAGVLCNLADSRANRETIVAAGAVPHLVEILCTTPTADELTAVAASALRNLAIDAPMATEAVAAAGGLPVLVDLLGSGPAKDVTLQAAGALCNLADSHDSREFIASAGAIAPLVRLLLVCVDLELPAVAAGALSNLSIGSPANRLAILEAGAVPPLLTYLAAGAEEEVTLQSLAALSNLSTLCPPVRDAIRSLNGIPAILEFLKDDEKLRPQLVTFAAATTRNILVNNPENAQLVAGAGGVPLLLRVAGSAAGPDTEAAAHAVGALFCLAQHEPLCEHLRSLGLGRVLVPVVKRARSEAVFVQALLALAIVYSGHLSRHPRVAAVLDRLELPAHLARILKACLSYQDRVYLSVSFATADAVFFVRACSVERTVATRLAELGVLTMLLEVVRSGAGGSVASADATRASLQICYARCAQGACGCDWLLDLLPALKGKKGAAGGGSGMQRSGSGVLVGPGACCSPAGSAASFGSQPGSPLSPASSCGALSPTAVAAGSACSSAAALGMAMRQEDLLVTGTTPVIPEVV